MSFTPGLLPPKDTDRRFLSASLSGGGYAPPVIVDLRPQLLPASNQGESPKCAAYAMAGWLEFYNWKYRGIVDQIDPDPIYDLAKHIDGNTTPGTTLESVLQAALLRGLIPSSAVGNIRQVKLAGVQQAIHRYGVILAAFDITESWENAQPNGWIPAGGLSLGGHAVLLCGYSNVNNPPQDVPWYAFQNSWGEQQGWRGFNRMTHDLFAQQFMHGLIWDFVS